MASYLVVLLVLGRVHDVDYVILMFDLIDVVCCREEDVGCNCRVADGGI